LLAARTTNEENQHCHAGGGFAGPSALMYLDKTLARRAEAEITLISRKKLCSVHSKCCLISPPKPKLAINSNECESD
jgi:hypothetical protein